MAVHLSYRPSTPAPSALPNPLRRSARLIPPTNSAPVPAPAAHPTTLYNRPSTPQSNPRKRQRTTSAPPLPPPVQLCRPTPAEALPPTPRSLRAQKRQRVGEHRPPPSPSPTPPRTLSLRHRDVFLGPTSKKIRGRKENNDATVCAVASKVDSVPQRPAIVTPPGSCTSEVKSQSYSGRSSPIRKNPIPPKESSVDMDIDVSVSPPELCTEDMDIDTPEAKLRPHPRHPPAKIDVKTPGAKLRPHTRRSSPVLPKRRTRNVPAPPEPSTPLGHSVDVIASKPQSTSPTSPPDTPSPTRSRGHHYPDMLLDPPPISLPTVPSMPDLSTPPPPSPPQPHPPLPLSLHVPQLVVGEGPPRAPSPPTRVPLQIELQEAPPAENGASGQYAMQERDLWYEDPPRLERGCGVWKMACKLRVWDIRRRYTPHTIRSVVAQEADDYFSTTERPASPHPSLDTRHGNTRAEIGGVQYDHDGMFMSEEYYDWEIKSDDEDEDEDEDVDGGPAQTPPEEGEDDPDAEGDLEIDLEALDDPTFNPGLTSPPASPSELMGVGGRGGEMSAFYVPPVADAPQEETWSCTSNELEYIEREQPASPLYHPQQQQQLPPGEESLYRYAYPNPMQLQQHVPPPPTPEHPHHPAPILSLPPPKLGSIRVYALRGLDLGMKVIGRGTPIDRARAVEWGWGMRRVVHEAARDVMMQDTLAPMAMGMGTGPVDSISANTSAGNAHPSHLSHPIPTPAHHQTLAISGPSSSPSPPLMGGSPFDSNQADWEAFLDSLNTVGNASLPVQDRSVAPPPPAHQESEPTGELDWFSAGSTSGNTGGDAAAGGGGGESTLSFALG